MDYDIKYDIRLATINDIDGIMLFIDTYWKKGHILGNNKELFYYEHVDGDKVNFLLALDKGSASIEGILGFLPASKDTGRLDIWTGIWRVKSGVMPLLGMEMYKRLQHNVGARSVLGVGDSQISTGPLLRKLTKTFYTWRMNHYYFLNESAEYKIANICYIPICNQASCQTNTEAVELINISQVEEFFELSLLSGVPYKDLWYVNHRYFQHPIYKYHVFGLQYEQKKALIVFRIQGCNSSRALRIVDYIGEQLCFSGIYGFISAQLFIYGCEYADFYVHGFKAEYLYSAGFSERMENDTNIIPNYFAPFEQKNVEIYVSGNIEDGLFCKADGDQDRPN